MLKVLCFVGVFLVSVGFRPIEIEAQLENSKIALETIINMDESPSQIANKFILIDFWATWCKPCIQTHPLLENLYAVFKDRLTVIGISNETESLLKSFVQKHNVKFPIARDYKGFTHEKYKIKTIPASFLLDPAGNIIWSGHPAEMNISRLSKLMASHKNKKPKSDKIWIAPPKKKVQLEKDVLSAPVFLNNRKTITVQKSSENKIFELVTNETSVSIEGPIHEIWSYLMCVPKQTYQYTNPMWNNSYRIEISDVNIYEKDLKDIADLLLEHASLDFSIVKKHHSIIELNSDDLSKLWSSEVFEYSEFSNFPSFMEGEDFFEGDNMSLQRLSFHLSNSYEMPVLDISSTATIHDWSIELSALDVLSEQLETEYGVKLNRVQKEIHVFMLL